MICFHGGWVFHKSSSLARPFPLAGGREEGTPYNDLYEEAPTERGLFSLVEVYERGGNLLFRSVK